MIKSIRLEPVQMTPAMVLHACNRLRPRLVLEIKFKEFIWLYACPISRMLFDEFCQNETSNNYNKHQVVTGRYVSTYIMVCQCVRALYRLNEVNLIQQFTVHSIQ